MAVFSSKALTPVTDAIRERTLAGTLQGLLLGIFFLSLLFLYLPLAYRYSYVNFTYGVHGLDPAYKAKLPLIFLKVVLLIYGFEVFARGFLLRMLLKKNSWHRSFWIHLILLNLIALPVLHYSEWSFGMLGFFRGLLMENILMAFWALFFLKTGSVLMTGLMHGAEVFLRTVLLNDVTSSFETLYFYSAASDDFYAVMIVSNLLCVSILVWINQKFGMAEVKKADR